MHVIRWARCASIARHDYARRWLQTFADLGHAPVIEGTPITTLANRPLDFRLFGIDSSHPYIANRGISRRTATFFGIGYYSGRGILSHRVLIPIHNQSGDLIAYAGRSVDGREPKYRLPPVVTTQTMRIEKRRRRVGPPRQRQACSVDAPRPFTVR